MNAGHVTTQQIALGLADVRNSPRDEGTLKAIVVRPTADKRALREVARLSRASGVEGDKWATSCWLKLPDGQPDPRAQVSLMNARILRLISREEDRICLGETT